MLESEYQSVCIPPGVLAALIKEDRPPSPLPLNHATLYPGSHKDSSSVLFCVDAHSQFKHHKLGDNILTRIKLLAPFQGTVLHIGLVWWKRIQLENRGLSSKALKPSWNKCLRWLYIFIGQCFMQLWLFMTHDHKKSIPSCSVSEKEICMHSASGCWDE